MQLNGVGLGLQFLRHVERTRILFHFVDSSGVEGRDPVDDFNILNNELKKYSEKLAVKKQILIANKIDLVTDNIEINLKNLEKLAKENNISMFKISAATGEGIEELLNFTADELDKIEIEPLYKEEDMVIYTLETDKDQFEVIKLEESRYKVQGPAAESLMRRINIEDNESMSYFLRMLVRLRN